MKIIFMGTHQFAVKILEKILEKHEVVLVVTQPDSYVGRKKILTPSAVKTCAIEHGLKVFQPEKLNSEKEVILNTECDLIVTAAYGQIIGMKILEHPRYKSINVHGSLLPKYRGGAPIQRAVINGDEKTGITIMYMSKGMDEGDIIAQEECEILNTDTSGDVFDKLSTLGSEMILDVIDQIEQGTNSRSPQDHSQATYAYNLKKEDELLDFNRSAQQVYNQIRGLNPNPGAYFTIDDVTYKVFSSCVSSKSSHGKEVGTIANVSKVSFDIVCLDDTLITISELIPQGKRLMSVRDYLNGAGKNIIIEGKKVN